MIDLYADDELRAIAMDPAQAVARIACPRCKAQPGERCVWRVRPTIDGVHAPRFNRLWKLARTGKIAR